MELKIIMTEQKYTFTKFSSNPFYEEITDRLIQLADIQEGGRIIDLACGTGLVTKRIMAHLTDARDTMIIGVDHSASALREAVVELKDAKNSAVVFVESQVEQLSEAIKEKVDAVFYCNAIHYVPDKDTLIQDIAQTIKPGGKFVFNTSFYDGPVPESTLAFYRKWMFKAHRILNKEYGLRAQKSEKVESRRQLNVKQYRELVERNGFQILKEKIDPVKVPLQGWIDISKFSDFIEGSMPGVPFDKASAALRKAARQTFEEMKITYTVRNWLDIVAVRV